MREDGHYVQPHPPDRIEATFRAACCAWCIDDEGAVLIICSRISVLQSLSNFLLLHVFSLHSKSKCCWHPSLPEFASCLASWLQPEAWDQILANRRVGISGRAVQLLMIWSGHVKLSCCWSCCLHCCPVCRQVLPVLLMADGGCPRNELGNQFCHCSQDLKGQLMPVSPPRHTWVPCRRFQCPQADNA